MKAIIALKVFKWHKKVEKRKEFNLGETRGVGEVAVVREVR